MANIIKLILNTRKLTTDIEITRSKYLRTYNRYKNDKHSINTRMVFFKNRPAKQGV